MGSARRVRPERDPPSALRAAKIGDRVERPDRTADLGEQLGRIDLHAQGAGVDRHDPARPMQAPLRDFDISEIDPLSLGCVALSRGHWPESGGTRFRPCSAATSGQKRPGPNRRGSSLPASHLSSVLVSGIGMTIENGRPFRPELPAQCWQASAGRVRQPASGIMFFLRWAAILALSIVPARASDFSMTGAEINTRTLFHRVAVFSDTPNAIHDPRHPQSQTGPDKMFAPIGLVWTNHRQPDQGTAARSDFHMGTGFLVSPCYILTAYHVVFGYRLGFLKGKEQPEQDVSATFSVGGQRSRAVPVKYGRFSMFPGRDWVLLRLEPDAGHRCLGEEPTIGWARLAPLTPPVATKKSLSVAGYPADKSLTSLWRQDKCHFFEIHHDIDYDGMWTTDCATQPRSSGAPIFFVADGVLNVVAVMSGHEGSTANNAILPKWDPNHANLALDIGKIISSDRDVLGLIEADIARFHQPNPARAPIGRGRRNYNQVRPHSSLGHRPPAPVTEASGRSVSKRTLPLLASAST
jgi:hypothetical protein